MEKIAACKPLDATASLVTQKGIHFEPTRHINPIVAIFDECPVLTVYRKWPSCIPKLTGIRFGRFTVQGLALEFPKRWVARCDCGKYQLFTAKAIRNTEYARESMCQHCRAIKCNSESLDRKHRNARFHDATQWTEEEKAANRIRMGKL
jgi:hypothetical protein